MTRHIGVLGLEEFNLELFGTIRRAEDYRFHGLLDYDEVAGRTGFDMGKLLEKAARQLREAPRPIDAVVGYWDFPTTIMLPALREVAGLPSTSLESILRCIHKYWSRRVQREVVPELIPRFTAFDPFAEDPLSDIDLDFPFWIKPVKAHSSILGFRIESERDFSRAIERIRTKIHRLADPFNVLFRRAELPDEIAAVDGTHCIAEEIIAAEHQCTLEGYVFRGQPRVYGVVDSLRESNRSSFSRYQYPSRLRREVQGRMTEVAGRVLRRTGLDNEPFNMEFFYDPESDRISLLEINPRVSKSHFPLFAMVEGASNQEVMVEVALGVEPNYPRHQGEHSLAAKFMVRRFEDGRVRRVPAPEEIRAVERELGVRVQIKVEEGDRLSELEDQDSYSYEVAEIFVGGKDQQDVEEKYRRCLEALPVDIRKA